MPGQDMARHALSRSQNSNAPFPARHLRHAVSHAGRPFRLPVWSSRASLVRDARRPVAVHPVTTTPFVPPSSQLSPWTPLVSFLCVALLHREPIAAATITTTPLLFFPVFSRQVQGQ
ncbi:hypothetical protein VFPFJ_05231 [Purpureocillium lilacinum]|uniref:Uncharacterized protein n=1 Tax=Purpureocillium lilacinum TaxID=33203 RepID=A0A179HMH2_PURLI|nr:hypothetical protein VFPFJ_05231 [Purpureocillium lilacinum]OAQ91072.1 hypothetical protein VFPFJ_05231 [Purpureocillium lilacinum]